MAVPTTGIKFSDIIREVEITSRTTFIGTVSFSSVISLSTFPYFDTAYLNGATDLSGIKSFGQYRNYPTTNSYQAIGVGAIVYTNYPSSNYTLVATLYDNTSGSTLIGSATFTFTNPGAIATRYNYPLGTDGDSCIMGWGGNGGDPGIRAGVRLWFDKTRFKSVYPSATSLRIIFTGDTDLLDDFVASVDPVTEDGPPNYAYAGGGPFIPMETPLGLYIDFLVS